MAKQSSSFLTLLLDLQANEEEPSGPCLFSLSGVLVRLSMTSLAALRFALVPEPSHSFLLPVNHRALISIGTTLPGVSGKGGCGGGGGGEARGVCAQRVALWVGLWGMCLNMMCGQIALGFQECDCSLREGGGGKRGRCL